MGKKIVLKRKIKIISLILGILVLFLLYFLLKLILSIRIQNIYIKNNNHLSDDYIIESAYLMSYPSYFENMSMTIERRLERDVFIKDATVSKSFFGVVNIEVEENDVLFFNESSNTYVLSDRQEVDKLPYDFSPVRVVNYIPDTVYDNFCNKFSKLDYEVRSKISQIKYDPSEYDNSRFLLYMVDGNYVYLTITKFNAINYYNEIYPTLDNKKGILYLDSGNHFQEFN